MAEEFGDFRIPPGMGKLVVIGVIVLVVIFAAGGVFGTVGAGQRGVLLHFGAVTDTIYEEGLYYKIPFVQESGSDVHPDSEIHRPGHLFQQGLAGGLDGSHLELPVV